MARDYPDAFVGDDELYSEAAGRPSRLAYLWHLAGAVTSLGLVAGIGIWGYQLAVRDVTGVPVVRALEGPMRVAPADPGGERAPHQGLAVNAVKAEGVAAPLPDRVALAPADPGILPEDRVVEEPEETAVAREPSTEDLIADAIALADELVAEQAAAEGIILPENSLAEGADLDDVDGEDTAVSDDTPYVVGGVVVRSKRPVLRPRTRSQAAVAPASAPQPIEASAGEIPRIINAVDTVAATPLGTTTEIAADEVEKGAWLVQLGAFDTVADARAEWARLDAGFRDLLAEKSRVVQKARSGGRDFYRLRAHGFRDQGDARRFCSALLAERAACIPVVTR